MRVVIAPDSFKSTMTAVDAAQAIAQGWAEVRPSDELVLLPMADGGEGTLDAFAALPGAERVPVDVVDALGEPRRASFVLLPRVDADGVGGERAAVEVSVGPRTAVVELAECCGLLTIDHLAPREAHTLGFGVAIRAALEAGAESLLLAIGGSASTDGGLGLLVGLGLRIDLMTKQESKRDSEEGGGEILLHIGAQDVQDAQLPPVSEAGFPAPSSPALGNAALPGITGVDWADVVPVPPGGAVILSDVTNPLLGPDGAAAVFGPQKGGASLVEEMDANLAHWASVLGGPNPPDPSAPGAGAAGGAGYALLRWGATSTSGARAVADAVGLRDALLGADLVITGEGSFDAQTASGKVVDMVRQLAVEVGEERGRELPVAVVAGRLEAPFDGPAVSLWDLAGERALADAVSVARDAGRELVKRFGARPQI